jgi:hypothetical protein
MPTKRPDFGCVGAMGEPFLLEQAEATDVSDGERRGEEQRRRGFWIRGGGGAWEGLTFTWEK